MCLLGKSASGKSTIEKALEKKGFKRIISVTTRPMRQGEVDGIDYEYISKEELHELLSNNQLAEHTIYNAWGYGIKKSEFETDEICVCVIEPHGYRQIKAQFGDRVVGILLEVDDKERLIRSLTREPRPDVNEIVRRFISDKKLFRDLEEEVDCVIHNWNCEETVRQVMKTIVGDIND